MTTTRKRLLVGLGAAIVLALLAMLIAAVLFTRNSRSTTSVRSSGPPCVQHAISRFQSLSEHTFDTVVVSDFFDRSDFAWVSDNRATSPRIGNIAYDFDSLSAYFATLRTTATAWHSTGPTGVLSNGVAHINGELVRGIKRHSNAQFKAAFRCSTAKFIGLSIGSNSK